MAADPKAHMKAALTEFRRSWLGCGPLQAGAKPPRIRLTEAVQQRQRFLLGSTEAHPPNVPYSLDVLAASLQSLLEGFVADQPAARPVLATAVCALMGELCGTALVHGEKSAGDVYPSARKGGKARHDQDWERAHEPLRLLRNAVCHPGAIKPPNPEQTTHVVALRLWIERNAAEGAVAGTVRDLLGDSLANVNHAAVTRWAVERVALMGRYEIERLDRVDRG